jgi:division protein CdvB (Snf7/Vps24/ESCRT-III family)
VKEFLLPLIGTALTALITWFFARRKTNAEAKMAEIDAEVKAAEFYKSLLDDAMKRLDSAIATINNQDTKIQNLINQVEHLTDELKKYKQLNGKLE